LLLMDQNNSFFKVWASYSTNILIPSSINLNRQSDLFKIT